MTNQILTMTMKNYKNKKCMNLQEWSHNLLKRKVVN